MEYPSMKTYSLLPSPKTESYTQEHMSSETLNKCRRCKQSKEINDFVKKKEKYLSSCILCYNIEYPNRVVNIEDIDTECSNCHNNFINKIGIFHTLKCESCLTLQNKLLLDNDIEKECTQCYNNFINKINEVSYNTCSSCREKSRHKNRKIAENRKNGIQKAKSYSFQSYLQVQKVNYIENDYLVCRTFHKQKPVYFVIDYHKRDVLEDAFYHTHFSIHGICPNFGLYSDNGYIARQVYLDEKKHIKQPILLHNILLNNFIFCGKGANVSCDHINRCPRDNRLVNLRKSGQTLQNYNQRKKGRKVFEKLDFSANFIPKNICFNSSKNTFTIEFSETDTTIYLQSILKRKDAKISNSTKLLVFQEILKRANEHLPLKVRFLPEHFSDSKLLEDEFNTILRLTTFPKDEIEANISKNHEFVFANKSDSFKYERKSKSFFVLVPTEEQKEEVNALIEKYDKEINDKVQEIIKFVK